MKYLKNIKTIEELKTEYRRLAFLHHPDKGGSLEAMQTLNGEYDMLLKTLKSTANVDYNEFEYAENFKEVIEELIKCAGLEIEICGSWIWLTGNTKPYTNIFKELGFRWRKKKIAWSLGDSAKKHYKELSMDKIRELHGSQLLKGNGRTAIAS